MKIFSFLILAGILFQPVVSSANPRTVVSCKKRSPLVYASFTWVEIIQNDDQSLAFQYGTGLEDRMYEIYFNSPVTQVSPNEFQDQDPRFDLSVAIKKSKLSFSLSSGGKTVTKKNFKCEILPLN